MKGKRNPHFLTTATIEVNEMKKIAILLGSVLAAGAAQAEPLTLSGAQMDSVSAAGPAWVDAWKRVDIQENIDKKVDIYKQKYIQQKVDLFGFYADADGAANCFGVACETLTFAITDTNAFEFYSTSVSGAESAAMPFDYKPIKHDKPQKQPNGMKQAPAPMAPTAVE
jgi:hypothetical protein